MGAQNFRSLQEAYMEVVMNELDEGAAGDVADRATKLANQRRGQTPERRATYRRLAKLASERENPSPSGRDLNDRSNMTPDFRRRRRGQSDWNIEHDKPGTVTKNPKKLRKQKALGEIGEQYDIYDIILSHLLDEGYASTVEAAEVIMMNMGEDWRESIVGEILDEANRGDEYATRGMSPTQQASTKRQRRDYRNTSGGHLYYGAATDERMNRHRGLGGTSRPASPNRETYAQSMMQSSDGQDRSNTKNYVRKQLKAQRSSRKYIENARGNT